MKNVFTLLKKANPVWYRQCYDLPMDRFVRMIINWDLNELIIQGKPAREDLLTARSAILYEYKSNIETSENLYYWQLESDIREITAILDSEDTLNEADNIRYKNLIWGKQKELDTFKKANPTLNFTAYYFDKMMTRIFNYRSGIKVYTKDITVSEFLAAFYVFTESLEEHSKKNKYVW